MSSPPPPPPPKDNSLLRVQDVISLRYQTAFQFEYFNKMQSILLPTVYNDNSKNLSIASPTGSGKTVIHELAILRTLEDKSSPKDVKIVFIAPNKALCQQRAAEWTSKFATFGLL